MNDIARRRHEVGEDELFDLQAHRGEDGEKREDREDDGDQRHQRQQGDVGQVTSQHREAILLDPSPAQLTEGSDVMSQLRGFPNNQSSHPRLRSRALIR